MSQSNSQNWMDDSDHRHGRHRRWRHHRSGGRHFHTRGRGDNRSAADREDWEKEEPQQRHGNRPAHLRGREIGLWYARQGQRKKEEVNRVYFACCKLLHNVLA